MLEFDEYIKDYDMNNYDIAYKYHHSYRVQKLSDEIAKRLKLNEEDIYLANTIGLLHDIGRFEQIKKYNTYRDSKSIDHATYGSVVLFKENLIDKFNIPTKYYDIIDKAIRNHNKLEIEAGLNERELLHTKIIRDADKIDIFNALTDLKAYNRTKDLKEISPIVEQGFYNKKPINIKDVKTNADKLLITLAFIYDINYKESLDIIKEHDYINKLYNQIENKEEYKEYFDFINNYIEERMVIC